MADCRVQVTPQLRLKLRFVSLEGGREVQHSTTRVKARSSGFPGGSFHPLSLVFIIPISTTSSDCQRSSRL